MVVAGFVEVFFDQPGQVECGDAAEVARCRPGRAPTPGWGRRGGTAEEQVSPAEDTAMAHARRIVEEGIEPVFREMIEHAPR